MGKSISHYGCVVYFYYIMPPVVRPFKKFEHFEGLYRCALAGLCPDAEHALKISVELERTNRSVARYVKSLGAHPLFDAYLKKFQAVHNRNMFWLALYIDHDLPNDERPHKERAKGPAADWQKLQGALSELKKELQAYPANSLPWRRLHKELSEALYGQLKNSATLSAHQLRHGFAQCAYAHVSGQDPQLVRDWVHGYSSSAPEHLAKLDGSIQPLARHLRAAQWRRGVKIALRRVVLALLICGLSLGAHVRGIDRAVFEFTKEYVLKICGLDPLSLSLKHKRAYFNTFIVNFDDSASLQTLRLRLGQFLREGIHQAESEYHFAEQILQPYFILLSRQKTTPRLRARVLEAAGRLDPEIQKHLQDITVLFVQKKISAAQLRRSILDLRRAFVPRNVFLFTFIVVKNDNPYLLSFPEKIQQTVQLSSEDFAYLGLDAAYYSRHVRFPLNVYVVEGSRYPFKDRSGYFEGEFGIVFSLLAAKTEWTAWHEFAHIIDKIRWSYARLEPPLNTETNAVLLPAIFTRDAKEYVMRRLLPIVSAADPWDAYVQASKGILNGIGIYLKNHHGLHIPPITDKFNAADITAYQRLVESLNNNQIKAIARILYQNPAEYLATAGPGQYRGIISNAEEIVAGSPRAPFQGFILKGFGKADSDAGGIEFLFDDTNADDDFLKGKNFWTIFQQLVMTIFNPRSAQSASGLHLTGILIGIFYFLLIEGFFLFLHALGSPWRKRKFYGPSMANLIDEIYRGHPVSDGRNRGAQAGERLLLKKAFACTAAVPADLALQIKAFKATASFAQHALFDTALSLAPANPVKSKIRSKWHDLLFWLPFLGPAIARHPWFFPGQQSFQRWEDFNCSLRQLARSITPSTKEEEFRKAYLGIAARFQSKHADGSDLNEKIVQQLKSMEESLTALLNGRVQADRPAPLQGRPRWAMAQDGDFDHLAPYSWQEDVKRIDWKATARSASGQASVKKYAADQGSRVDFILDFRSMSQQPAREQFAADLAQALFLLTHDSELKDIIMIMPKGELRISTLNIKRKSSLHSIAGRIWAAVNQTFRDYINEFGAAAPELDFYTADENRLFRRTFALTDFDFETAPVRKTGPISTASPHSYLIGLYPKPAHFSQTNPRYMYETT